VSEVVGLAPAHPSKIASVHVPSKIRKTNSRFSQKTFRALNRQNRQKEEFMKTAKQIIAGIAMLGASLSFTTTASADWSHRGRELRHDRRELGAARRELGRDLRRGAGPAEIARDRAAIARERREIWQNRRDWRNDRWGYRGNYPHRSWGWRDDDHGRRPGWWNWRR